MDKSAMKTRELGNWTRVAPGWRKYDEYLSRTFRPVSERLLDEAGVGPGHRVLDIASGTGEPAIPAALRVGDAGFVLGSDFVEEMLACAREKADAHGLPRLEFRRLDGELLDVPDASFDAVTMRWGLMFMPDPGACLKQAYRALRPGGRIALSCWAAPERNPWLTVAMGVLKRYIEIPSPPAGATGIFAFADPSRLRAAIEAAGFRDVRVDPLDVDAIDFATGAEYFSFVFEIAGPLTSLYAQLDQATQEQVARDVAAEARRASRSRERVSLSGVTWVATGTK
ncbi:MAG TPA: methyltransferase domain-containing protein [Polyangia bacterium]|nr:methyltransferase domain-containing protein [Polyangia bacterium]